MGDSRAVLSRFGQAVPLSEDHKPNLPQERARIERAGGFVEQQHNGPISTFRINGNLNLSRSIGDLDYKCNEKLAPCEQIISSTPDIIEYARQEGDEFLLLASDGVWDRIDNQEAVDFVRERLAMGEAHVPLSRIMEELLDECFSPDLAQSGGLGGDNMTAILVLLDLQRWLDNQSIRSSSRTLWEKPYRVNPNGLEGFGLDFFTKFCACQTPDTRFSL